MTPYQLNIALWQIPTMVVSSRGNDASTARERQKGNAMSDTGIDERVELLEQRLAKATSYFATQPAPPGTRVVTVFAAPEYLFARSSDSHFVSQEDKDRLLAKLAALSRRYPEVVLFPGTIAWKKAARHSGLMARLFRPSRERRAQKRIDAFPSYHDGTKKRFEASRAGNDNYFLAENTCFVLNNGETVLKYHKRHDGGEVDRSMDGNDVFWVPGPRDPFFTHRGLEFGLQICAEMNTDLSRAVDLQVAISASFPLTAGKVKVHPGGYACHADAVLAPRVLRNDPVGGGVQDVTPNVRRHGGGTLSNKDAEAVATTVVSQTKDPTQAKIEEQTTVLRGRSRYYVLAYNKA